MYSQTPFYSKIATFLLLLSTQCEEKHLTQKKRPGFL